MHFMCVSVKESTEQLMSYLFFTVIKYATNQNIPSLVRWYANGFAVIVMSMVDCLSVILSCRVYMFSFARLQSVSNVYGN